MPRNKSHMFSEIEDYREALEIKHLRTKNLFVVSLMSLIMVITLVYMLATSFPLMQTISLLVGYLLVIIFNFAGLAYGGENYRFYQLNKYITTLYIYVLAIATVFVFKSPSAITALFIAYAISAYYQDLKVILISNLFLLFSVIMFMINYPEYMNMQNASLEDQLGISIFFFAFVGILTISSYIIVKQKQFFYNQIALSKETEFRNIDLLIDLQKEVHQEDVNVDKYYEDINAFLEEFSKKLEIENAFTAKMQLLKVLEKGEQKNALQDKYPEYSREDLDDFEELLIGAKHKLRKISIKMSHTFDIDVKRREMFSETHFKSFNHQADGIEIKIIAFVVFYTALKRGLDGFAKLDEQTIREALTSTDYFYYIDPRVMRIYQKNSEVFDTISEDILRKKVNS